MIPGALSVDALIAADTTRGLLAVVACVALGLLAVALRVHPPGRAWCGVVWAFTGQQGALAYATVARARAPDGQFAVVDSPLLVVLLSTIAIVVATIGVFAEYRHEVAELAE